MDKRSTRCAAICGENTAGCFMANKNHLECITDIVINRAWAAREIIELGSKEKDPRQAAAFLNTATEELDELVFWMQELRIREEAV